MAGDIGWKSVELQIEALIPGILMLAEAHALAPVTTSAFVPANEFAKAALFVAAGYSVGVVSSLVSRLLVDSVSERGPRMVLFDAFAHHALDKAIADCNANDPRFPEDLKREKVKRQWDMVASWNAVYRSALRRTTRRDEVDRRRSQGRFVRNLLIPVVVAPFIIFHCPWSVLFAITSIPFLVFLYAYAEYVNFAEAYDISETKPK